MDPGHGYKMFCAECGTHLPNTAKFCLECGHKRESPAADTVAADATDLEPRLTVDGRVIDPTRDLWGRSLPAPTDDAASDGHSIASGADTGGTSHSSAPSLRRRPVKRATVPMVRSPRDVTHRPTYDTAPECSRTAGYLGIGASILVIIGSLGPWATLGMLEVSGTRGDGQLSLIAGILAAAFLAATIFGSSVGGGRATIAAIALAGAGAIGVYDWQNISGVVDSQETSLFRASVGWGLPAVTIGGVGGAILALIQADASRFRG